MRQLIGVSAVAAAAMFVTGPASAQDKCFDKGTLSYVDCPQPAPAPAPAPAPVIAPPPISWTGWYLGAHVGYGASDIERTYSGFGLTDDDDFDLEGWVAGGQVGYLHQFSNSIVFGAEIDGSFSEIDGSQTTSPAPGATVGSFWAEDAEIDYLASARLRLGYAFDNVMPYVTGGVAVVGWEYNLDDNGTFGFSADETSFGGVVGGGLEILAGENWVVGGEGLYYIVSDSVDIATPPAAAGDEVELDDVIVGRFRLSYRF